MLSERANEMGWNDSAYGIVHIPKQGQVNAIDPDKDCLLANYGEISMDRIIAFKKSYINTSTRAAQDGYMMFRCIWNSLSRTGRNKVQIWEHQYTVNQRYSGNLLLKIVIRESHLDSNATTTSIRESLSSLDVYILTIQCDIVKFNGYVKLMVDSLAARGETTTDLLVNLFKAYTNVSDKVFVSYMGRKKELHEEGANLSLDEVMTLAANKYKQLKDLETWNAPSPEEEKIMALEARINKMRNNQSNKKKEKNGGNPKKGKKPPHKKGDSPKPCLLYTSPSPRDKRQSRMPSSA